MAQSSDLCQVTDSEKKVHPLKIKIPASDCQEGNLRGFTLRQS